MPVEVVPYAEEWPAAFERVADDLRHALADVPAAEIEHVGSTSVPGLAAKPIIDIDVIVDPPQVRRAVAALEAVGYVHVGDLEIADREAFTAPDDEPRRHVYVCTRGTLPVRNHLAVRDLLRRSVRLRKEYAAVKLALAADPDMDIDTYMAGKCDVLEKVLAQAGLTEDELRQIRSDNGRPV